MADHNRSAILALLLVIAVVAASQLFKASLTTTKQGRIFGGAMGTVIFLFTLTAISNIKMAHLGSDARSGLAEVLGSLLFGAAVAATIHGVSVTVTILVSAILLVFLTGLSHSTYSVPAQIAHKKRNYSLGMLIEVLLTLCWATITSTTLMYPIAKENFVVEPQYGGDVDVPSTCAVSDCTINWGCMLCNFPDGCRYGEEVRVNCSSNPTCLKHVSVYKQARCMFCWQLPESDYTCDEVRGCDTCDVRPIKTTCRANPETVCMGRRIFFKNVRCKWTNGYSWSKAVFLSVTLGGFGIDRFYLGLWKSAIGKLFSFGGLGLWTLVDIVLITLGYVGPADGSEYI